MHSFGDAEETFLTLFLNTFCSSTRVKWGISDIEVAHTVIIMIITLITMRIQVAHNNNYDNNTLYYKQ